MAISGVTTIESLEASFARVFIYSTITPLLVFLVQCLYSYEFQFCSYSIVIYWLTLNKLEFENQDERRFELKVFAFRVSFSCAQPRVTSY